MTALQKPTPQRRLRLLVDFAEGRAPKEALRAILALGQGMASSQVLTHVFTRLTEVEARPLRDVLRMFLGSIVDRTASDLVRQPIRVELIPFERARGKKTAFYVKGTLRDVLLYQVATLLETVPIERLARCQARDCGQLFVKRSNKVFCSTRCQSRTYMQHWRAEERAEKEALIHGKTTRTTGTGRRIH